MNKMIPARSATQRSGSSTDCLSKLLPPAVTAALILSAKTAADAAPAGPPLPAAPAPLKKPAATNQHRAPIVYQAPGIPWQAQTSAPAAQQVKISPPVARQTSAPPVVIKQPLRQTPPAQQVTAQPALQPQLRPPPTGAVQASPLTPGPRNGTAGSYSNQPAAYQQPASFPGRVWSNFKELIGFTANVIQNIDGLIVAGLGLYVLSQIYQSVIGRNNKTIKTSTGFDHLGAFTRESEHLQFKLEDVWQLGFHEKTVRACFAQATEKTPFLCIRNRGVWLALHDFFSGMCKGDVSRAVNSGKEHLLRRVSHILTVTYGDYETRQARIENLPAPKLLSVLRNPFQEYEKAAGEPGKPRRLEKARQMAKIETAAIVCWKAPHIVADALMEPELTAAALQSAPGNTLIEKKINLEKGLHEKHRAEYEKLLERGRNLGKLILLNRQESHDWLSSISGDVPALSAGETEVIKAHFRARETFVPWTHRLVDLAGKLPFLRKRFPHDKYVEAVSQLEAEGWLVRVYVNVLDEE